MPQTRVVALVGHPNSGKTSLFNHLTQSRYKTQNYPGSTVDFAKGELKAGIAHIAVLDTPGIQSLVPKTEDERVARRCLTNCDAIFPPHPPQPDLVLVVVSAAQPMRHLALVKQIQDAGFPVAVAMTMGDLDGRIETPLDAARLSDALGCPVFEVSNKTQKGLVVLVLGLESILKKLPKPKPKSVSLPDSTTPTQIADDFRWVSGIIERAKKPREKMRQGFDWDSILLHPVFGFAIFTAIMGVFFWSIFALAAPFMNAVKNGIGFGQKLLGPGILSDGVLGGVGSVVVFIPQIFLLFFGMGILDSTGYLARGAILVDKPLSKIGLNGRSFVPLLSACACAIPAMMAARTIPGKKERLLTLFVIPLMTCSARLPVYGLLLGLIFGAAHPWRAGFGLTAIYFGSIILASATAAIAGRILKIPGEKTYFQIELPLWHRPIFKHILTSAYHQTMAFCKKAGPTIFALSIVLWLLGNFPNPQHPFLYTIGAFLTPVLKPMGVDWRVGVSLLMAFAAREVFVSSLSITGAVIPGIAAAVGLIVFFMVAMQCMSTVAIARKEMGNWKLPIIMTATYTLSAYVLAVVVVQALSL